MATTFLVEDAYSRSSPRKQQQLSSKLFLEPTGVPWRKHQKAHSSVSLSSPRRSSVESLGSLRQSNASGRCVRWKTHEHLIIEKLSSIAHFHYDFVELGPVKVELLPDLGTTDRSDALSEIDYHRRSDQHQNQNYQRQQQQQQRLATALATAETAGDRRVDCQRQVGQQEDGVIIEEADEWRVPSTLYKLRVHSNQRSWIIQRTYADFVDFDKQLHRCVYDRRFSLLKELSSASNSSSFSAAASADNDNLKAICFETLHQYLERFSDLAGSLITCFPVLKWLELDNRGNHLVPAEETSINTPAIAAAYVVQNYAGSANDELTLKVGDIVSVIDMPPVSESIWWRGKLTILKAQWSDGENNNNRMSSNGAESNSHFTVQVGFFPSHCVQVFGNRVGSLPLALRDDILLSRPVFRRRGKWATLLRLFLTNRPSRRRLKEAGILKERVFGCDLAEHLEGAGIDIPVVLKCCANVIETYGIVDGIYRLSGVASNIQRLRNSFDENRVPNMLDESILHDIHCVASVMKMYVRELPNPIFTYQLYGRFVEAVQGDDSTAKIVRLHDVVQQLPPPHFRTAEYLIKHLMRVGEHGHKTGMHFPNLAIVWAPNLLRCKELENIKDNANVVLRNVNVQAIIVEYLIRYADIIFSRKMPTFSVAGGVSGAKRRSRPSSIACASSLSSPKLINLEEAQRKLMEARQQKVPANIGLPDLSNRKCIDVNGGPASLPPKYHTVIDLPSSAGKTARFSGLRALFQPRRIPISEEASDGSEKSKTGRRDSAEKTSQKSIQIRDSLPVYNLEKEEVVRRKRLRTTRSVENIHCSSSTRSSFCSLDAAARKTANRRSLRQAKYFQQPVEIETSKWICPSSPSSDSTFSHSPRFDGLTNVNCGSEFDPVLKSCMATDIDQVLSIVVSMTARSSSAFDETRRSISNLERVSANYSLLEPGLTTAIDSDEDSSEMESAAYPKQAESPEHHESEPRLTSAITDEISDESVARLLEDVSSSEPPQQQTKCSLPTPEDVHQPAPCLSQAEEQNRVVCNEIQTIELMQDGMTDFETLESEEKLLAQLSKTPENSPSRNDLQALFPELKSIYNSVTELHTDGDGLAICVRRKSGSADDDQGDDATSLADLEVLEINPEWQYRTDGDKVPTLSTNEDILRKEERGTINVCENISRETTKSMGDTKSSMDSTLIMVDSIVSDTKSVIDTNAVNGNNAAATAVAASPAMNTSVQQQPPKQLDRVVSDILNKPGLQVEEQQRDGRRSASELSDNGNPKISSFHQANALFDRLETLQAVQSGQCDSDDDTSFMDSIYDNVLPLNARKSFGKPVPKPRMSKLRQTRPSKLAKSSFIDETQILQELELDEDAIKVQRSAINRPTVLPIRITAECGDQQLLSSSDDGELANSPLFRKQQMHLSTLCDTRNKSEPPSMESVQKRLGDRLTETKLTNTETRSESHLQEISNSDHRFAPSPGSAFSPVAKTGSSTSATRTTSQLTIDDDSKQAGDSGRRLQSILATRPSQKDTPKQKNVHVYFV